MEKVWNAIDSSFNTNMSEELFEHHKLVADPGQQPLRVDKFLMNLIAHISRNKLQIAAKSGYIRVDGLSLIHI